jgi:adenylosuccinate lyase
MPITHLALARLCALLAPLVLLAGCSDRPEPGSVVDQRQQQLKQMLKTFEIPGGMVRGRIADDPAQWDRAVKALAQQARAPWPLFNEGTPGRGSRAKPEVWTDAAGFKARQQSFFNAVDELANVRQQTQDPSRWRAAVDRVEAQCVACHQAFRTR